MSRLYRFLLVLYPPEFRNKYGEEQATVFDEMWHRTLRDENIFAAGGFAIRAMIDLFVMALLTGDGRPGALERFFSFLAVLFLIPSTIFATVNITKYNLGEPALYDWWSSMGIHLSDAVILGGPLAAMAILLLPLVHLNVGSTMILQRSSQKLSRWSIVIAGGSVMIMGIFIMYGIVENIIPAL
ncbi:MAG: hypothetical protein L0154_17780 [Chloroflexi bacterium]|nr:hypothetical protein [Chloroflexota bacterium]